MKHFVNLIVCVYINKMKLYIAVLTV